MKNILNDFKVLSIPIHTKCELRLSNKGCIKFVSCIQVFDRNSWKHGVVTVTADQVGKDWLSACHVSGPDGTRI